MKEEKVFSVAEYFGNQLEEFQNFTDAKEGYEISRNYATIVESEYKAIETHYETLESMLPNGDFTITIKTFYGTYEFEGFNRTNLIH